MPDLAGVDLLDARLPGSAPRRAEGSGKKRRDARTPVHPRPHTELRGARSHLSSRAIAGRRLCRTGFADLRGAAHRAVSRVCALCERMDTRRLRRRREGAGPNWPRAGQLRSWSVPTCPAGVAGRRAISERQTRSGACIGRHRAEGGGKDGGSAARSRALSAQGRGVARRRRDGERGRDRHAAKPSTSRAGRTRSPGNCAVP